MVYNPDIHHRRSIRFQEYDYSRPGAYFITICTQNREGLFGNIIVGAGPRACPEMVLNQAGTMVQTVWNEIPTHYTGTEIDEFIVMPNHIHGIIVICAVGAGPCACPGSAHHRGCPDHGHHWCTHTEKRAGTGACPYGKYGNVVVG